MCLQEAHLQYSKGPITARARQNSVCYSHSEFNVHGLLRIDGRPFFYYCFCMSNLTKLALEQSLKRFLLMKPLDKITIKDLTDDVGISRMSFYYHFKDIYDLVEWSCIYDATNALKGNKTYDTWQEGLTSIFEAVLQNKPFILNVYHTTTQDSIERFLFTTVHDLILGVVREKAQGTNISEEQIQFIADFYKYSFVGIMLDWIGKGMNEDYNEIVYNMANTLHGSIANSISNFTNEAK